MPVADFLDSRTGSATRNSKRSPASATRPTGRPCTTWPRATRERRSRSYAERGRLILGDDLADTMQRLVAEWRRDKTDLKEKLILSSTNHQAAVINRLCQWERQKHGELALKSVMVAEGAKVHSGDRVLFTRNDKQLSVNNGDLGTVIKVRTADEEERSSQAGVLSRMWRPTKGETLTVKLDGGELVTVALSTYDRDNIRLGYCVTTHKAQREPRGEAI